MDIDKLSYEKFGFTLTEEEFRNLFQSCEQKERIKDIAIRIHLIDLIRYRLQFKHSFFSGGFVNYFLDIHIQALQLYLLCTCIVGLSGEDDFIDFPSWLNQRLNDNNEKGILESIFNNFSKDANPSNLLKAAYTIHQEIYSPKFGNTKGFRKFFLTLPDFVKEIIAQIYSISNPFNPKDHKNWLKASEQITNWPTKSLEDKIKKIADYFYTYRRNSFTHKISANSLVSFSIPENVLKNEGEWVSEGLIRADKEKLLFFHFKPVSFENEYHVLRFALITKILEKIGRNLTSEQVQNFREYQILRENLYSTINEFEYNLRICTYYNQEHEFPYLIPQPNDQPDLPKFETQNFTRFFNSTKMIPNFYNRFNRSLTTLNEINKEINDLNKIAGHKAFLRSNIDQSIDWDKSRHEAFYEVQQKIKREMIQDTLSDKLNWMNENIDHIWLSNIIPLTKPFPAFGCLPAFERTPISFSDTAYSSQFCIDNPKPQINSEINFYGRAFNSGIAVPNIQMTVTINFKDHQKLLTGKTDTNGIGHCAFLIENEPANFEVYYFVGFSLEDGTPLGGNGNHFTPIN